MNKPLLTLLIFPCLLTGKISLGQNQWQWLNPQPSGYGNVKIVFSDHQHGFILNSNGDLLTTQDQGANWKVSGQFPYATAMDLADSTGVIVTSRGTIYLSLDNGHSWDSVTKSFQDQLQFVNVVSQDTFFVSTAAGTLYRTGDRGNTWTILNSHNQLNCITFLNSTTGFAGTMQYGIQKTTDGGQTWTASQQLNAFPLSINAIQFLDPMNGYAFQYYDSLLVTHDGGITWKPYLAYQPMHTLFFVNPNLGYLGGWDGAQYRSTDGGITWNEDSPPGGFKDNWDINSLYFISPDTGFAVGNLGRILKTTDSGQTWTSYSATHVQIMAVSFGSPSTGYAADRNFTYKTSDTGHTWQQLNLSTGTAFGDNSIFKYAHFTSADTGYFISDNYVKVHKTNDGGKTWTTINPAGDAGYQDLNGAQYPKPGTGILSLGTLFTRTTDGGGSWTPLWSASYSGQYFEKIFYLDSVTAFATQLNNNQLFKTTDGFKTWSAVYTNPLNYSLSDICFLNPQKGFITDEEAQIFMTNDGGNSWQQVPFADSYLYATGNTTIRFFNDQVGYISTGNTFGPGNYGRIYKTVDGGLSWQRSYGLGGETVVFTPDSNVVVAGYGGVILRSPVSGWQLDSFTVSTNHSCGEQFSASIGVALGSVDSLQFVVKGPGGKTSIINAGPGAVSDGRVTCTAAINQLQADSTYTASLRFRYNGSFIYSQEQSFIAQSLPAPYAYDSSGVLISSPAPNHQWYLQGNALPGATGRTLVPTVSGQYSVLIKEDSCISPLSQPVNFIANNLGVVLYPNPARYYFYLMNTQNRSLEMNLTDLTGRNAITPWGTYAGQPVGVSSLPAGEYIVHLRDKQSGESANILLVKLP